MKIIVLVVALAMAACNPPFVPDPAAGLPPGAVLVYANTSSTPTRVLSIGGCLFTEIWKGDRWLLLNEAFFGANPAIDCEPLDER